MPVLPLEQPQYSIIVPAYNEKERIGPSLRRMVDYLHEQSWSAEIIVVNDGSRDNTSEIVSGFAIENPEIRLVQNPGNRGKGFAVWNGMLQARGNILLFTDADLSSPISEAPKLFAALQQGADVVVGSRWMDPSMQTQRQSLRRQLFSRAFNLFLKIVLGLNFHDTQCGFKVFTRRSAEAIFPLQKVERFGFDPEILFLARTMGFKTLEVPVVWANDDRSTVNPLRDGFRMGVDALKVRWNSMKGRYVRSASSASGR